MKPPYTSNPAAWDQSTRIHQSPADYANPFQGHHAEHRMSLPAKALAWGMAVLFGLLLLGHFLAR